MGSHTMIPKIGRRMKQTRLFVANPDLNEYDAHSVYRDGIDGRSQEFPFAGTGGEREKSIFRRFPPEGIYLKLLVGKGLAKR